MKPLVIVAAIILVGLLGVTILLTSSNQNGAIAFFGLNSLEDVFITNPTTDNHLVYNGTYWTNQPYTGSTGSSIVPIQPNSFLIHTWTNGTGTFYAAQNGTSGLDLWTSTIFSTVFNSASAANMKIMINIAGTIPRTQALNYYTGEEIYGLGKDVTIIQGAALYNTTGFVNGTSNVGAWSLHDLTIDGNRANLLLQPSFFYLQNIKLFGSDYHLYNLKLINSIGHCIWSPTDSAAKGIIENCEIATNNGVGICLFNIGSATIRGNNIHDNGLIASDANGSDGIKIVNAGGSARIEANSIDRNNGTAITLYKNGSPQIVKDNNVTYNIVQGILNEGNSYSQITGNRFDSNGGNQINTKDEKGDIISGNTVVHAGRTPTLSYFLAYFEQRGIILDHCNDTIIESNIVTDSGQAGIHLWGTCVNNLITNNQIYDNGWNATNNEQTGVKCLLNNVDTNNAQYNNTFSNNKFWDDNAVKTQLVDITLAASGTGNTIDRTNIKLNSLQSGLSNSGATNTQIFSNIGLANSPLTYYRSVFPVGPAYTDSTSTTYSQVYQFGAFDPTAQNYTTIKFQCVLWQTNSGTFTIYAQLFDYTANAVVTGSEVSARMAQYGSSCALSGDLAGVLVQANHAYCIQIKAESGGKVAVTAPEIVVSLQQ